MKTVWVVGSGGLLGAALCRSLRKNGDELFFPAERLCWGDSPKLVAQLELAVEAFAGRIAAADQWEIYWAAGVGTMSSSESALLLETEALSVFLRLLGSEPRLTERAGAIGFASSAGAIYAGSLDDVITENTSVAPTTPYARAKLRQEGLVRSFTADGSLLTLIARISTLYGPGQAAGKQQGLLTHIARSMLRSQPIQIYVPFDTIRDYITADDAAAAIINALRAAGACQGVITKIIASENPTTIAEIISIFKRVARRRPRVVTSASRRAALYARRVQFRSIVLREYAPMPTTSLLVGIAQLLNAERATFVRSQAGRHAAGPPLLVSSRAVA